MAIYHLSAKIISRGKGQSAVASAAYRAAERLDDFRLGKSFDYSSKKGLALAEIFLPEGAPPELKKRETLWNAVEAIERRKDARLSREFDIALPVELDRDQQIELARDFAKTFAEQDGIAADLCVHLGDPENPHMHIMTTDRNVSENGIAKSKNRELNSDAKLNEWRTRWETVANDALARAGVKERIDHRSHKERGIAIPPTVHLGVAAAAMEARGIETRKGDRLRLVEWIKNGGDMLVAAIEKNVEKVRAVLRERVAIKRRIDEYLAAHNLTVDEAFFDDATPPEFKPMLRTAVMPVFEPLEVAKIDRKYRVEGIVDGYVFLVVQDPENPHKFNPRFVAKDRFQLSDYYLKKGGTGNICADLFQERFYFQPHHDELDRRKKIQQESRKYIDEKLADIKKTLAEAQNQSEKSATLNQHQEQQRKKKPQQHGQGGGIGSR